LLPKQRETNKVLDVMNRYASLRQTNPVEVTDDYAQRLFESAFG